METFRKEHNNDTISEAEIPAEKWIFDKSMLQNIIANMIDRDSSNAFQDLEKVLLYPRNKGYFLLELVMQFDLDRKVDGFDPKVSGVGLIVTTDSEDAVLDGVLSKKGNVSAVYVPYADIPDKILDNPSVLYFEVCEKEVIELLQNADSDEITIKLLWSGPKGDEWDSPAYNSFWGGAEQYLNGKIKTLESVGKKVRVA